MLAIHVVSTSASKLHCLNVQFCLLFYCSVLPASGQKFARPVKVWSGNGLNRCQLWPSRNGHKPFQMLTFPGVAGYGKNGPSVSISRGHIPSDCISGFCVKVPIDLGTFFGCTMGFWLPSSFWLSL